MRRHQVIRSSFLAALTLAVLAALAMPSQPANAAFPGSNGLIAYTRIFFTKPAQIFVMNPDGSNQHQLSSGQQIKSSPAWSADGSKLAYGSYDFTDSDIWVMNADGTGIHDVTNDPNRQEIDPAWSPDGTQLAFWKSQRDGNGSVWVVDADGSDAHPLTTNRALNARPSWSPDGQWIAFVTNRSGNYELYKVHPDGTELTRITHTPRLWEDNPDWAPDGSLIAFDACTGATYPCGGNNYEVFTMRPDGTGVTRLTFQDGVDFHPAFAPDGTEIAFRSDRAPNGTQLWKMNVDGSDPVPLTTQAFTGGTDPDWQPLP